MPVEKLIIWLLSTPLHELIMRSYRAQVGVRLIPVELNRSGSRLSTDARLIDCRYDSCFPFNQFRLWRSVRCGVESLVGELGRDPVGPVRIYLPNDVSLEYRLALGMLLRRYSAARVVMYEDGAGSIVDRAWHRDRAGVLHGLKEFAYSVLIPSYKTNFAGFRGRLYDEYVSLHPKSFADERAAGAHVETLQPLGVGHALPQICESADIMRIFLMELLVEECGVPLRHWLKYVDAIARTLDGRSLLVKPHPRTSREVLALTVQALAVHVEEVVVLDAGMSCEKYVCANPQVVHHLFGLISSAMIYSPLFAPATRVSSCVRHLPHELVGHRVFALAKGMEKLIDEDRAAVSRITQ
ncbi:MAG: hypothetical protein J0M28_07215 [Thauera sp.]|nr:hypothetical protein [Thauera sp.]